MEGLSHLSEAQRLRIEQIDHIVVQGPEVLQARLKAFMRYEVALPHSA